MNFLNKKYRASASTNERDPNPIKLTFFRLGRLSYKIKEVTKLEGIS